MNTVELNRRCVELFHAPGARRRLWHPRMFWHTHLVENPKPEDLQDPKVDLAELEFLLARVNDQASLCADEIEAREPGRTALLQHMIDRGEMPLLRRPEAVRH